MKTLASEKGHAVVVACRNVTIKLIKAQNLEAVANQ